jgi:hypothetical protein
VAEETPGPAGGLGPDRFAPKPQFEYRAPSFLWEHRYLLILFLLVLIVVTVLLFRAPHREYRGLTAHPPPSSEPVYVEPIPQPASSPH